MVLNAKLPANQTHAGPAAERVAAAFPAPAHVGVRTSADLPQGLGDALSGSPRMAAQRKLIQGIQASQRMAAQRMQFESSFGDTTRLVSRLEPNSMPVNYGQRPVAQRMKTERAPEDKQIYNVSDSGNVVAGTKTPNHELYLKDPNQLSAANKAMAAAPLEVYAGAARDLFKQHLTAVELRFKQAQGSQRTDLQSAYETQVKPGIEGQRSGLQQQAQDAMPATNSKINVDGISRALRAVTATLELFKKLVQTTLANRHDERGIEQARKLVAGMEDVIYSRALDSGGMTSLLAKIWVIVEWPQETGIPADRLILDTVEQLKDQALDLSLAMPEGAAVDLISFHKFNFQVDALATVRRKDSNLLLYRACDAMASTVLGNELNQRNADQLKIYQAQGGAFHYAAKILTEGADWVTLESFAASDRERSITGVEDIRNLDQTWQYVMYGSRQGAEQHLTDEDRFFAAYTRLRYYLKGITAPGKFRSRAAENLTPQPVPSAPFEYLFSGGSAAAQARAFLKQLQQRNVILGSGLVNPKVRTAGDLKPYLDQKHHPAADEIRKILLGYIPEADIVQSSISSDAANLAAWQSLAGMKQDSIYSLLADIESALVAGQKKPGEVSRDSWSKVGETLLAKRGSD